MEALSSMAANKLFKCMHDENTECWGASEPMSEHVTGRMLSGLLSVAAAVETAVSLIFLAFSYGAKTIGAPKEWHDNTKKWTKSAADASVDCYRVAIGKSSLRIKNRLGRVRDCSEALREQAKRL